VAYTWRSEEESMSERTRYYVVAKNMLTVEEVDNLPEETIVCRVVLEDEVDAEISKLNILASKGLEK
jgi:hypothetical protein